MNFQRHGHTYRYRAWFAVALIIYQPLLFAKQTSPDLEWQQPAYAVGNRMEPSETTGLFSFRNADPRHYAASWSPTGEPCTTDPSPDPASLGWYFDTRKIRGYLDYQEHVLRAMQSDNLEGIGVDPATLRPESYVPNFFPVYPLSAHLQLAPSLFYGEESVWLKRGDLEYGAPKMWQTHFGELVRVISDTRSQQAVMGRLINENAGADGSRYNVPTAVQTYFVDQNGTEISFFPDPDQFGSDPDVPENGTDGKPRITTWYSNQGLFRLQDQSHASADEASFVLESPNGVHYEFERYKVTNRAESQRFARESLSVHYRAVKIVDPYGNYLKIFYCDPDASSGSANCNEGNQPVSVRGYRADASSDSAYYVWLNYEYDDLDRVTAIEMPKFVGSQVRHVNETNVIRFYYPDQMDDRGFLLARESGVKFKDGRAVVAHSVAEDRVAFDAVSLGLRQVHGASATGTIFRMDFDSMEVPANIRTSLSYPRHSWEEIEDAGFYTARLSRIGLNGLFRVGSKTDVSPQEARPTAAATPHVMNLGDGNYSDDPEGEQSVGLVFLNGNRDFTGNPAQVDLFPLIKNGDVLVGDLGNGQLWRGVVNDPELAKKDDQATTFNPRFVKVSTKNGAFNGKGSLRLVRRENLYRIAAIVAPAVTGEKTHRRVHLSYDEHSVNHQEIQTIATYHDRYMQGLTPLNKITYELEMVRSSTSRTRSETLYAGEDLDSLGSSCTWCEERVLGTPNFETRLDWVSLRLREVDILRKKTVEYGAFDLGSGTISPAPEPLVTHFGGAYNWVLSGQAEDEWEDNQACMPNPTPGCTAIAWALGGRLFKYTWMIQPDGSALVNDLSPKGTDLEPMAYEREEGSRVFKTYHFDSSFKSWLESSEYYVMLDSRNHPFHRFLPLYEFGQNARAHFESPEYPAGHPNLNLSTMFSWKNQSSGPKCYRAEVSIFEPVPIYKYGQATSPANGTQFLREENLAAVNGRFHAGGRCEDGYIRASAVRMLAGREDALVEKYLKGRFTSRVNGTKDGQTVSTQVINWTLGGRGDFGNYLKVYQDRSITHPLRPMFTFTLRDDDGLSWNPLAGTIQVGTGDFAGGRRMSNGGFLFESLVSASRGSNSISLDSGAISQIKVGDSFHHLGNIYSVTAISGSSLHFQPALRNTVNENLRFYRHYNPVYQGDGLPRINNGYLGYDAFGNNGYSETYLPDAGLTWSNTGRGALVPDFSTAQAEDKQWNDSVKTTGAGDTNNDIVGWRYFGRTTNEFTTSSKPFNHYRGYQLLTGHEAMTDPETYWFRQYYAYTQSKVPDQPTRSVICFEPYKEGSGGFNKPWNSTLTNSLKLGDKITDIVYVDSGSNTLIHGKPYVERFEEYAVGYNEGTPLHRRTAYDYDAQGRIAKEREAWIGGDETVIVHESNYENDFNTGLTYHSKDIMGRLAEGFSPAEERRLQMSESTTRYHSFVEYDNLGRETRTYSLWGNGYTSKDMRGEMIVKTYDDPFSVEERRFLDLDGTIYAGASREMQDGLQRGVKKNFQKALDEAWFESFDLYDRVGRKLRTYLTSSQTLPLQHRPYREFLYDRQGRVYGLLSYSDNFYTNEAPMSSTWMYSRWNGQHEENFTIAQVSTETLDEERLNKAHINKQEIDGLGQLVQALDYQIEPGFGLQPWGREMSENTISQLLDRPIPSATVGRYTYDRFGQLSEITVENGGQNQHRLFRYDSYGRIRLEANPEIEAVNQFPIYSGHGQVQRIISTTSDQGTTRQLILNAAGKPTRDLVERRRGSQVSTVDTQFVYHYQKLDPTQETVSRYPYNTVFLKRDVQTGSLDSYSSAYRMTYDQATGNLLARSLQHNIDNRFPGFTANPGYDQQVAQPLTLNYQIDNQARLQEVSYPIGAPNGGLAGRTRLEYDYTVNGIDSGLLQSIKDLSLGQTLVKDLNYGYAGFLKSYRFGMPDGDIHYVLRDHDRFARLTTNRVYASGNLVERQYTYDTRSRIHTINIGVVQNGRYSHPLDLTYRFDFLGRLSATRQTFQNTTQNFSYGYDGFGNLNARLVDGQNQIPGVDAATNRLTGGFNYNVYGEMESGRHTDGRNFSAQYSAIGSMETYSDGAGSKRYYYDTNGLRLLVKDGQDQDDARLYFYNGDNLVLNEYVLEDGQARWDRSYFYLEGQTLITYEMQPAGELLPSLEDSLPAPPSSMPVPVSNDLYTSEPVISWQQDVSGAVVDLQIADTEETPLATISGLTQTSFRLPTVFEYGSYKFRTRIQGEAWGTWWRFVYAEQADLDLLVYLPLDADFKNHSFYITEVQAEKPALCEGLRGGGRRFTADDHLHFLAETWNQLGAEPFALSFVLKAEQNAAGGTLLRMGNLRLSIQDYNLKLQGEDAAVQTLTTLQPQTHHHLQLRYDGQNLSLIKDGQTVFQQANSLSGPADVYFGKIESDPGFDGELDEIRLFKDPEHPSLQQAAQGSFIP